VLHPPQAGVLGPDNANSLVLAVEYLGHRILLTGDLDSPGLEDVLAEEPLACDVLQAPHHGSRASNSPALAAWCKPEWVVVSGSRRWDLAPLRKTYGAVGSTILHTAQSGAVEVTIDPAGVAVRPFLQSNDHK
jgi:competence protein ComEC